MGGHFHLVNHTRRALPTHLPALEPADENEEGDSNAEDHQNLITQNLMRKNATIQTG